MTCCFSTTRPALDVENSQRGAECCPIREQDARITAIALGMISLILFALGCVCLGLGTLPPTTLMGLGMLPYLGGVFLNFIALGTFTGAVIFGVISVIRTHQNDHF